MSNLEGDMFGQDKKFPIIVFLVILLAISLRFNNYENRWGLATDQARDAIIGLEAVRQGALPMIGPFSQAGSVVMGPIWYWYTTLATAIFPNFLLAPWIVLTLTYVLTVWIMILLGKEIEGKTMGLILGLFSAISTSEILNSTNLTNPSGVAILSVSAVFFGIKYLKTGKNLFIFLFSLFISLAINTHLQASGLLIFLPVLFILKRPSLKQIMISLMGLIIPFLPLLVFELRTNFYDTRSFLDYILYGQYRIYVANRWLTYLGDFWPKAWTRIIGGQVLSFYLIAAVFFILSARDFLSKKINRPMLAIILSFFLIIFELRYFRGEIYEGYLIFSHPFILTITAWTVYKLWKLNKYLGLVVFFIIIINTMKLNITEINKATNLTALQAKNLEYLLITKFPQEKFAIYDFQYAHRGLSLPLVLFLARDNKISDQGKRIGMAVTTPGSNDRNLYPVISGKTGESQLFDLSSSTSSQLLKSGWSFINPSQVYEITERWYLKTPKN